MPFMHGKGQVVKLDSTAGSLVSLTPNLDDISFSRDMNPAEVTAFGNNDRNFIKGLMGGTFSLSGHFNSTCAVGIDGVFNDATSTTYTIEYSIGTTAAGQHFFQAETLMTSLEYTGNVDDKVGMAFELLVTGVVLSTNH
jgi:hypothetical protein